jgi:uncharacterized protein with HEPN domain
MSRSAREYLLHILDETRYLMTVSNDLDQATFLKDETLKRAITRSIEIIGEAVKQVPDPLRHKYPHVEWRAMAGMRDRLIHVYFSVDYDIVWDVVINHIPQLHTAVTEMLAREYPTP